MAYSKQTWSNLPSKTTPINATRLNHMENGIFEAASTADSAASAAETVAEGLTTKVDKVEGKGLSTNDFDNDQKDKLSDLSVPVITGTQIEF